MPVHSVGDQRWVQTGVNEGGDPVYERNYGETRGDGDYSEWTKDQLSYELESRGLPKSGNKDELIARLQEDDG